MIHHEIKLADLNDWIQSHWSLFASSSGLGSNKRFQASMTGQYRVTEGDTVVYFGISEVDAIDVYNSLP